MLGLAIYAWVSKLSTSLYPVLFIFVVSGLLNAFSIVISAVNKGLNDFTVEAKVSSFYSLLLIFFLAGAYFVFPRTSMTVGLCMLLSNALEFGAALLLVKPMMQTETGILPSHTIVRDLLKFGLPFALNLILATLYFQIDTLIVGQILNLEEVGFYQAAIRLVMATIPVAMILINAFYPRLVRAYDPEARKFITSDHQKMLAALLVLGIAGAILFNILAQPIINLIYGPKMLASVPILQIFALVLVFRFMAGGYAVLLIARGQQIVLVWAAGSATVVNVVLNLVLIPRFGIAGSAWVNVITNLLILLIYLVAFHNKRHVPLWGFRGAA
jgi:O-antigen/teichoic acid export membrane protein